jgi:hypothetical protein
MVKNWVMTHTIRNNKYDDGAQNQMKKKTKIRSPSPILGGITYHFAS